MQKNDSNNSLQDMDEILNTFQKTTPKSDSKAISRDLSKEREEKRKQCIKDLVEWTTQNPKYLETVHKRLFKLLEADNPEVSTSNKEPSPFSKDRGDNDLMRSYIPIFIGALYCSNIGNDTLKEKARKTLLARLKGEDEDGNIVTKEYSPTVRQWIIRILLRVFATDDNAEDLFISLNKIIDREDTVLTQLVIIVEVVDRLEKLEKEEKIETKKGRHGEEVALNLLIKKLNDFTWSASTAAARGLERLGPVVEEPQEIMNDLCKWLDKLQKQEVKGPSNEDCSVKKLADWELLTDEQVVRRAVIKAIGAVGQSKSIKISKAIPLLKKEAKRCKEEDSGKTDVAVVAVLALGKLGEKLVELKDHIDKQEESDKFKNELKEVRRALTDIAVQGNPNVANAAARALSQITVNKSGAAERIVAHYLNPDIPSNEERVAEACRVTDYQHAVDILEKKKDKEGSDANLMIKKIGGEYAFKTLKPLKNYQKWKDFIDIGVGGVTVVSLVATIIFIAIAVASDANSSSSFWFWSFASCTVFISCAFLASITLAFPFDQEMDALHYLISGLLAFVFSFGMIVWVSLGSVVVQEVNEAFFGPIYLFNETNSTNGESEIVASLTLFNQNQSSFSAPLWVVFLAVMGAAVLTVSVIVTEVSKKPDFNKPEQLRERVGKILQHQFYIVFAPLGALFVYRGLIVSGVENNPLTVAIAAFGAGLVLNLLLKKAVEAAGKALYTTPEELANKSKNSMNNDYEKI